MVDTGTSESQPRRLERFGSFLQKLRRRHNDELTQSDVAKQLTEIIKRPDGKAVSQALVAHYENGRVVDPDPRALEGLATCYSQEYLKLILELVLDKYKPAGGWSERDAARLEIAASALMQFPQTLSVTSSALEIDQLRAKSTLIHEHEILDIEGTVRLSSLYPNLERMWIIAPNFQDNDNPTVLKGVKDNIGHDVKYTYFVREDDVKVGGRFSRLRERLIEMLDEDKVRNHVVALTVGDSELLWLQNDHVFFNPHRESDRKGLQFLRRQGRPSISIRMGDSDASAMIERLMLWAGKWTEKFCPSNEQKRTLHLVGAGAAA